MMPPRISRTGALQFLSIAALIVGGAVVYALVDPSRSALFPECPFHAMTGLHCPGCGSQRALHALLNGHIGAALSHNLLTITLLLPLCVYAFVAWGADALLGRRLPGVSGTVLLSLAGLFALFGLLRNLPVEPFMWLGP